MNTDITTPPACNQVNDLPKDFVACLCATWCGTCRDYQARFESMQNLYPNALLVWVDIEDKADIVDPVDLENFPTLLISKAGQLTFFGVITPQQETLERMLAVKLNSDAPLLQHKEGQQLMQRLLQNYTNC